MSEKEFCKYCGEKVDNDAIVCPKCGMQLEEIQPQNNTSKFYQKEWFLWLMLLICAPIGIILLWTVNKKHRFFTKIILSIFFLIFFIGMVSNDENTDKDTNDYSVNKNVKVNVVDFSDITYENAKLWCSENKINCSVKQEYSDTVLNGKLIKQSVASNTEVNEGSKLVITYSMGKEPSLEYKNALRKAQIYAENMHMSKQSIYEQLTSEYGEGFAKDAAKYAIDNVKADWNNNALKKAESYANDMHMSKQSVYEQLKSSYGEKFTSEQAKYAIDNVKADWNNNALKKAESYANDMGMSKNAIYDQLVSSYGEKFTSEQAKYAVNNLYK